jgi:ArsR family transcriptional regulator
MLISREEELCVCELTCALDQSQPKVSRYLAQLRTCGLLADRRQGQWVYYRLHPNLPDWVHRVLTTTLDANRHWLGSSVMALCSPAHPPSPASAAGVCRMAALPSSGPPFARHVAVGLDLPGPWAGGLLMGIDSIRAVRRIHFHRLAEARRGNEPAFDASGGVTPDCHYG